MRRKAQKEPKRENKTQQKKWKTQLLYFPPTCARLPPCCCHAPRHCRCHRKPPCLGVRCVAIAATALLLLPPIWLEDPTTPLLTSAAPCSRCCLLPIGCWRCRRSPPTTTSAPINSLYTLPIFHYISR